MTDKKEITNKTITKFGIACVAIVLIFVISWIPISTEIQCITTPCEPIREWKSPLSLIKTHYENKHLTSNDPHADGSACIAIYAPVCGEDMRTYSNQCVANSQGVDVRYTGECESVMIP